MAELAGPPLAPGSLADWMAGDSASSAWHLMESDKGLLLGFQRIGPGDALPKEACEIATFLAADPLPPGAAAGLFDATATAARRLRYVWIAAHVAQSNTAARVYYQNRGFRVYAETGTRVSMRFDLD